MSLNAKVIKETFEKIKPVSEKVVNRFYEVLWNDYPDSKALFVNVNMEMQKQALVKSLVYIVDHLEDTDKLVAYLKAMGGRHVNYGLESEKPFEWVTASLLKTLGETLGAEWTPSAQTNWTLACSVISSTMLEGVNAVKKTRTGNSAPVKGHLQAAANPNPVSTPQPVLDLSPTLAPTPAPAVVSTPSPSSVLASTPLPQTVSNLKNLATHVSTVSSGAQFELPSSVKDQLSRAANEIIQKKLKEEFEKALKSAVDNINPEDIVSLLKKTG